MATGRSSEEVPYSCSLINRNVTVTISAVSLYGQSPLPVARAGERMEGCSGVHICGLFQNGFHVPPPSGCPYHDNLNKG